MGEVKGYKSPIRIIVYTALNPGVRPYTFDGDTNSVTLYYFLSLGKWKFYCNNTSYSMNNCFIGRLDRSRQMPEKDVLYIIPAGPVTECAFARCALYFLPV